MQMTVWVRVSVWLVLASMAMLMSAPVAAQSTARQTAEPPPVVTIGYVNWTEAVAVSHLMQAVLEDEFHYRVKLKLVSLDEAFRGVATGELDAFLDVWLPATHARYWARYGDRVDDLGSWYQGEATLGLAVPDYVDVTSIAELDDHRQAFGSRIVGIQADAGLMRVTRERAIPAYGLHAWDLQPGSTEDLVAAVDEAIRKRAPIVFSAWKPHWLFQAYPVRYLEDPKHVYDQADRMHAIVRKGLKADAPQAWGMFNAFTLSERQLGSLELTIANSRSAWGGVRRWLESNRAVTAPWVRAATPERRDYFRSSVKQGSQ